MHTLFYGWVSAGVALAAMMVGCTSAALGIEQNQRPAAGTCALPQEPTEHRLDSGVFDLALGERDSYVLTPLVRNRTEASVVVERAWLRVHWDLGHGPTWISVPCEGRQRCIDHSVPLCPEGAACPAIDPMGTASFEVPILPRPLVQYLQQVMDEAVAEGRTPPEYALTVRLHLEGVGLAEEPVFSDDFDYEVRVCLGCLVELPEIADAPWLPGPDCCAGYVAGSACYPGQDAPIDCRRCRGTTPAICNYGRPTCGR